MKLPNGGASVLHVYNTWDEYALACEVHDIDTGSSEPSDWRVL